MNKIMTYETLKSFAYSNEDLIKGKIRGAVIEFFGLGNMTMYDENPKGAFFAEKGILFIVPYNNPWAWMNRQSVDYTDEIVDVLFDKLGLDDKTPVVSTGGSMGGLASIVYAYYAKRTPVAVVSNCPVCDLVYHYTERKDLPRTLYSAFYNYECDLDKALEMNSPYHLAEKLPDIAYHIFHCDSDSMVNMEKHSVKFIDKMRAKNKNITFDICHGRDHCDLDEEMFDKYMGYCVDEINAHEVKQ